MLVELHSLDLLEEEDNKLKQVCWIVIRHCEVTFSLETTHEALNQETDTERISWALLLSSNIWHQGNQSELRVLQNSLLFDCFKGLFDVSRRGVFVQVDHLEVIGVLSESLQRLVELVFELVDGIDGCGFESFFDRLARVLLAPLLQTVLSY